MLSIVKGLTTVLDLLSPTKVMATPQGMEIYAARLASFDIAQPTTKKKRASGAKGAKTSKWPHKSPSPAGVGVAFLAQVAHFCTDKDSLRELVSFMYLPPPVSTTWYVLCAKRVLMAGKKTTIR